MAVISGVCLALLQGSYSQIIVLDGRGGGLKYSCDLN